MKTNLDTVYKTDQDLEKNGVWFHIKDENGPGFLVRPFKATNPRVKAAMAAHYKPYAHQIERNTLEVTKEREINIRLFVDVCLVDWKSIEIDGVETAMTKDIAIKLFTELPDLFDTLRRYSEDFSNYKEDLGNS